MNRRDLVIMRLEPMFAAAYKRRHYSGDKLQEDVVVVDRGTARDPDQ